MNPSYRNAVRNYQRNKLICDRCHVSLAYQQYFVSGLNPQQKLCCKCENEWLNVLYENKIKFDSTKQEEINRIWQAFLSKSEYYNPSSRYSK
jgi:hypothetical protein